MSVWYPIEVQKKNKLKLKGQGQILTLSLYSDMESALFLLWIEH